MIKNNLEKMVYNDTEDIKESRVSKMSAGTFLGEAEKLQDILIADRRYLHQNPGIGFDIEDTKSYVKKQLTDMGYESQFC